MKRQVKTSRRSRKVSLPEPVAEPESQERSPRLGDPFVGVQVAVGTVGGPVYRASVVVTPNGSIAGLQTPGVSGAGAAYVQRIESLMLNGTFLRVAALILGAVVGVAVGFMAGGVPGAVLGAALGAGAVALLQESLASRATG